MHLHTHCACVYTYNHIYRYADGSWQQITVASTSITPPTRSEHAACIISPQVMVVHGGWGSVVTNIGGTLTQEIDDQDGAVDTRMDAVMLPDTYAFDMRDRTVCIYVYVLYLSMYVCMYFCLE
jgi:hypothetical protein